MRTTTSSLDDVDLAGLVDPKRFAEGYPHDVWAALRRHSPVHWCELDGFDPFWAATRHADIKFVSTHPDLFSSAGRLILTPNEFAGIGMPRGDAGAMGRNLLNTDPPVHREYRNMAGPYFRPRVLRDVEDRVRDISRELLDAHTAPDGGWVELDFATEIASWHPLKMIAEVLGATEEDQPIMLRIANEIFGSADPEFATDPMEMFQHALSFVSRLIAEKRANPSEDLASVLVASTLHGEPVNDLDIGSYLLILITAGHDTTRHSLSGGLNALMNNPDQLDLLRRRPELCASAADEIVRWATPVTQFMRTATQDTEIGGQPIAEGDTVALFYASGNRDETVFEDPWTFRVDRDPNPHLAWGVGEHYCIGASLARMEIRVMLEELVPRLRALEPTGPEEGLASIFVSGLKHLPIRWQLDPDAVAR